MANSVIGIVVTFRMSGTQRMEIAPLPQFSAVPPNPIRLARKLKVRLRI